MPYPGCIMRRYDSNLAGLYQVFSKSAAIFGEAMPNAVVFPSSIAPQKTRIELESAGRLCRPGPAPIR